MNSLTQCFPLCNLNLLDHHKKISVVAEVLVHNKANCTHRRRLPLWNYFARSLLNAYTDLPRNKIDEIICY